MVLEPLAERGTVGVALAFLRAPEQVPGGAIESRHVGDHPVKPGRHDVRALGEQPVRGCPAVLEVADAVADAERHRRRLPRDTQVRQQALEVGVVAVVEDDEPGVDMVRLIGGVDPDRVRVSARVSAGFEHRDLVLAVQ